MKKTNAILGYLKAYNITIDKNKKFIMLNLIVSTGDEDFPISILARPSEKNFWKKMFKDFQNSLEKIKKKDKKIDYIG